MKSHLKDMMISDAGPIHPDWKWVKACFDYDEMKEALDSRFLSVLVRNVLVTRYKTLEQPSQVVDDIATVLYNSLSHATADIQLKKPELCVLLKERDGKISMGVDLVKRELMKYWVGELVWLAS